MKPKHIHPSSLAIEAPGVIVRTGTSKPNESWAAPPWPGACVAAGRASILSGTMWREKPGSDYFRHKATDSKETIEIPELKQFTPCRCSSVFKLLRIQMA